MVKVVIVVRFLVVKQCVTQHTLNSKASAPLVISGDVIKRGNIKSAI